MAKKIELSYYQPTVKNDYFGRAKAQIDELTYGASIFFDVDGTAIYYSGKSGGRKRIRTDFDRIYYYLLNQRPDIKLYTLSYRSKGDGIPELSGYAFAASIYSEHIDATLNEIEKSVLVQSILAFLRSVDQGQENNPLILRLQSPAYKKLLFLLVRCTKVLSHAMIIDDGDDGLLAQKLRIGVGVGIDY